MPTRHTFITEDAARASALAERVASEGLREGDLEAIVHLLRGMPASARAADERAMREYERLLERLTALASGLGVARDLTVAFLAILDFALASAPCDGLIVSLFNADRQERRLAFVWSTGEEIDLATLPAVPEVTGPQRRAIDTGEVVFTDDFQASLAGRKVVKAGSDPRVARSSLAVPMAVMGRIVGAIEVQSFELAAYTPEHATALRMAANLAAIAIENVRLLEGEREREEQLRQSQKMEAVGRLAGGVAHDFNNLLTVITGYTEIALKRLPGDAPIRAFLEEARAAANRAAGLTHQLLAFSRKQVLQPKVLDLNDTVEQIDKMLRRLIGEDVELELRLDEGAGAVFADPGQVEQVLMNLAVNARDAMPHGGRLTIETAAAEVAEPSVEAGGTARPGAYIMVAVRDTGTGMDEATKARVFEPFFTTKEQGKGTGLGLSTVFGIVTQSEGFVRVESEPGQGTTIRVYLPRTRLGGGANGADADAAVPSGEGATILLIEDEAAVRRLTRVALEGRGYRVLEAASADEALELAERNRGEVGLVISDVVMPGLSGPRLVARLRERVGPLRVLFISGYTDDAISHHGVLDDGVALLSKPFTPDSLARKVHEVLASDEQPAPKA
jgi:signal transduction histidine kinase/ActR/RegA family two-component response regulator